MIYTVTFNPSLDYMVAVEHFQMGVVNRSSQESIYPGGKGINVSVLLANLEYESTALGFIAGFIGDEIVRLLTEKGIKTDFIRIEEGNSRINVKLHAQVETEINGQGPKLASGDIKELYQRLEPLKQDDILVLAGSIPSTLPDSMYMDIMDYVKEKGVKVVVDATKDLLMNVLPFQPFLIKPNYHELGELFGVELQEKDEVISYAKKLQEKGARNVLVSMAGEGAVLITEDSQIFCADAPKGEVISSVGAGDSMVAGFLVGYLSTGEYKEAFRYGVCCGSASAFSSGIATKPEIEILLDENRQLF